MPDRSSKAKAVLYCFEEAFDLSLEFFLRSLSLGKFAVERHAILDAATQELRPLGDGRQRGGPFREKTPELWMMPAEVVS
jgi:hypothetical protein